MNIKITEGGKLISSILTWKDIVSKETEGVYVSRHYPVLRVIKLRNGEYLLCHNNTVEITSIHAYSENVEFFKAVDSYTLTFSN